MQPGVRRLPELVGDDSWNRVASVQERLLICGEFPTTSATAIVSPRARPKPSIVAPTIPLLAYGSTAIRIVS